MSFEKFHLHIVAAETVGIQRKKANFIVFELPGFIQSKLTEDPMTPEKWADDLLSCALKLDDNRPCDDISVVVVAIIPNKQDDIRRVQARMPI